MLRNLLLSLALATATASAGDAIPEGKSSFIFEKRSKSIPVMTYRPDNFTDGPMIVVLHGMNRNATDYRDRAVTLGNKFKALIIAPEFDGKQFSTEAYQRGGVTQNGKVVSSGQWSFRFFTEIIEDVRKRAARKDMPCYLIGHSAGGQILSRMAAFQPDGITRIVASNPGSLLFPNRDLPFPYGFGGLPSSLGNDTAIRNYLASPLTLYLGTADIGNQNLDQSQTAMLQGKTRIERGRACYEAASKLAKSKGWQFNWQLVEAEGIGHSSTQMFAHKNAKLAIFGQE
jgi:poly(3-hydroxybutyrate) depolymerase